MLFVVFIVVHCIPSGQVQGLFCSVPTYPKQLRVALRGLNGVTISWRTSGYFGSNDTPSPQVTYGTSSTLVNAVYASIGTSSNYDQTSFFHNVALCNLSLNKILLSDCGFYSMCAAIQCLLFYYTTSCRQLNGSQYFPGWRFGE